MNNARLLCRLRDVARAGLYLIIVLAVSAGGWAALLQHSGNIHAVTKGMVYRSAQLNGEELTQTLEKYGIKSVINLRGDSVGDVWYTDELAVTAAQGVMHYDIRMSAKQEPDTATIKHIFEVLRAAPRPLLIHCSSGSDRTGLVAAIYKYFVEGRPDHEAAGQLSFRFGHFPWLGSRTVAMDEAFQHLVSERHANAALR